MPMSWEQHVEAQENAANWEFITKLRDDCLMAMEEFELTEAESLFNKLSVMILEELLSFAPFKKGDDRVRARVVFGPSRLSTKEYIERINELCAEYDKEVPNEG